MATSTTDYTDLYNFSTDTGLVVPAETDVTASVQEKFKAIFGAELDFTEDTIVGRFVEAFSVLIRSAIGVTAQNANQMNLNAATGIYLDALGQLFGLQRRRASHTKVKVRVTCGKAGCTILKNYVIRDVNTYDKYSFEDSLTIEGDYTKSSLTGELTAVAIATGPIKPKVGALSKIVVGTNYWNAVTNPEEAFYVGQDDESDEAFRARIIASRAFGSSSIEGIKSRISRIETVKSCSIYENNTNNLIYNHGILMEGHSIFVCVDGGDVNEVAEAIVETKPPGISTVKREIDGLTKNTVTVAREGYSAEVTFYRPTDRNILVDMTVDVSAYKGDDVKSAICECVVSYVSSLSIGATAYAVKLARHITESVPNVAVAFLSLGPDKASLSTSVDSYGYEKLSISKSNISITTGAYA